MSDTLNDAENLSMEKSMRESETETATTLIMFALSGLTFLFLYGKTISGMVYQWSSNDMYAYGFLVPVISLYLIWTERKSIADIGYVSGGRPGLFLLAAGLSFFMAGFVTMTLLLQELSIPIVIAGVVSIFFGREMLKKLTLPLAYLFFMVPLWNIFTDPLMPHSRLLTAVFASGMMRIAGIPVFRTGTQIELPNVTLEVADECSGINFLIAVVGIGIPLAYMFMKSWTRRIGLVIGGVGIAMLFNGIRVGLIGILSHFGVTTVLHGPGHMLQALSVSVVGYLSLFAGCAFFSDKDKEKAEVKVEEKERTKNTVKAQAAVIIAFAVLGAYVHAAGSTRVPLTSPLDRIPAKFSGWTGQACEPFLPSLARIRPDRQISRVYRNSEGDEVSMYVGYFEAQDPTRKLVSYLTEGFFSNGERTEISGLAAGYLSVHQDIADRGQGKKKAVLAWHEISGHAFASRVEAKLHGARRLLTNGRSNGALVVLVTDLTETGSLTGESARLERFAQDLMPHLQKCIP